MATRTISVAGGNYNAVGTWDEGIVPTAADDVVARGGGDSGNLTVNVNSACRSADFTNYAGTLSISTLRTLNIGDPSGGSLKLVPGMGFTFGSATTCIVGFPSTTTGNLITTAGKTLPRVNFGQVGGWTLQDAMTLNNASGFAFTNGSLDLNGQNVSAATFSSTGTNVRVLTMGAATFTVQTSWNIASVNFTMSAGASTIVFANGTAAKTFTGGDLIYNNLQIATGVGGSVTFAGSNTFSVVSVTGGAVQTLTFTAGTTQTLTGGATCFPSGAASNLITCGSSAPGTAWSLALPGDVSCDYLSISDCTVTTGKLYCGTHSTDGGGNNANVVFTDPPAGAAQPPRTMHQARLRRAA